MLRIQQGDRRGREVSCDDLIVLYISRRFVHAYNVYFTVQTNTPYDHPFTNRTRRLHWSARPSTIGRALQSRFLRFAYRLFR